MPDRRHLQSARPTPRRWRPRSPLRYCRGGSGERERQLRPELAGHPLLRRGDCQAQQPARPARHRHGLLNRRLADPNSDGLALVDERGEASQAAAEINCARQRLDFETAHPMAPECGQRVLQAGLVVSAGLSSSRTPSRERLDASTSPSSSIEKVIRRCAGRASSDQSPAPMRIPW